MPNIRRMQMAAAGAGGGYASGSLLLWGSGALGTMGDGGTSNRSSPAQLGSDAVWADVAGASKAFVAIKTDGTLWAWGYNGGKLGLGDTANRSSPVQVGSLTNWASLTSGGSNSFHAIKTDGTLWGWGNNAFGQLGDGSTTVRSSPVQIGSLTTWASVSNSPKMAHAIKTDGTMWGWGYTGARGGLGDNTTVNKSSPVQIGALTTWASVTGRHFGGHAIKTDGTLWGWGRIQFGQIGDGSTTKRSSPVQIGTEDYWADAKVTGAAGTATGVIIA